METYSLLQQSLGQTISREALEEASVEVPSVARGDCAGISRSLFGIVISRLPYAEALAFQRELAGRGFPTEVVADRDLPRLHQDFTVRRIEIDKDSLSFTDAMGRIQMRPKSDLVFVAGGFLNNIEFKSEQRLRPGYPMTSEYDSPQPIFERRSWEERVREFRLDFFFGSAPNRLRGVVSENSTLFFHGRPLRLRQTALLLGAMMDLRELLPPERVGAGLGRSDTTEFYPSIASYEEEIRWHFYRLIPRG